MALDIILSPRLKRGEIFITKALPRGLCLQNRLESQCSKKAPFSGIDLIATIILLHPATKAAFRGSPPFCFASTKDFMRFDLAGEQHPTAARAVAGYGEMIAEGSKIIHDGDKPHNALTEAMGLSSEVHGADEAEGLADSENPMEPVNEIHRYLSGLVGSHRGFSRGGLQDG